MRRIGAIPQSSEFAGRLLDEPFAPTDLCRCQECLLAFRWPLMDKAELDALYRAGTTENWSPASAGPRPDWDLAAAWVAESNPRADVLDVGCFDGGFAERLPTGLRPFGVEIHREAARHAAEHHGVEMVADDFADLGNLERTFDAVVAFDLIEHVHDPRELVASLIEATAPGGSVIVGTGNVDAPTWRFERGRYWYCWYPEHIAFISPRWAHRAAASLGLEVVRIQKFARNPVRRRVLVEAAHNLAFLLLPQSLLRRLRRSPSDNPPIWASSRDHVLVEFRRPS
ncbi:hypothetical protein GCM10009710_29310 [Aeromicrobium alkaliterrae]|uniref:Class I SAM-dependent methyltransferase n=1 Tax=Aeromicrobium alkaliterrae TaxID=302168 RepID=A0ABN2K338_9ACTN